VTPAGQEEPCPTGTRDGFSARTERMTRIGLAVDQLSPAVDLADVLTRLGDDAAALALIDQLTAELTKARQAAADLSIALESNRAIGAATGILMAQFRVSQPQAFDMLRVSSQTRHVKLREIARQVVDTGALTTRPGPER
jgi:hypothetical protein